MLEDLVEKNSHVTIFNQKEQNHFKILLWGFSSVPAHQKSPVDGFENMQRERKAPQPPTETLLHINACKW